MSESCSNCRFSMPAIMEETGVPVVECRRYPPHMITVDDDVVQCQVQVEGDDWCGEWQSASAS